MQPTAPEMPSPDQAIKNLQAQLKQAGTQIQALEVDKKYRLSTEGMKQEGETRRELIKSTTKAHNTEVIGATKRHDTEVRAVTTQNKSEIDGLVKLLLAHVDTRQLEMEIAQRDAEQAVKHAADDSLPQPMETSGA